MWIDLFVFECAQKKFHFGLNNLLIFPLLLPFLSHDHHHHRYQSYHERVLWLWSWHFNQFIQYNSYYISLWLSYNLVRITSVLSRGKFMAKKSPLLFNCITIMGIKALDFQHNVHFALQLMNQRKLVIKMPTLKWLHKHCIKGRQKKWNHTGFFLPLMKFMSNFLYKLFETAC